MRVSADRLLGQARERFSVQDYYGAAHLLEDLIAAGHRFADAHQLLGLAFAFLGRRDRALQEFDRALEINPRYTEALIHRGVVLSELGRTEEAAASFHAAVGSGDPPSDGFTRPIAARLANQHAGLGDAYAEAGAYGEAIEQFRRAVSLGPAFHDLRYRLARLLLEAGRPLEAREELQTILSGNPEFRDAATLLGLAHYLAGDAVAARDLWTRSLARWPHDARLEAYLTMSGQLSA
ncbi:MAG TPA: tetratricopeptide repeat protein [Gemmatimonadales bacterium]|nr:tetratricopeptide repeat protein [Gemmatimonadales bacterium]